MTHRVVLVDDHPVVVMGARQLIEAEEDLAVVATAHDAPTAIRLAEKLRPDAVVLDLHLGADDGADVCSEILRHSPRTRVLIYTAFDVAAPLQACLQAGAAGVVFKDDTVLVTALRTVLAGGQYVDLPATKAPPDQSTPCEGPEVVEQLTPREYQVLRGFAVGQSTREVAANLHLTENTVRSYTKSLLAKLGANSRLQALAIARRLRLLS